MNVPFSSKSISDLSRLIKNKDIKVIEVVRDMLQHIETKNDELNAFITINPEAEDIAHQMDRKMASVNDGDPLFGIPIGVKDMIDTYDMTTTMGSEIYKSYIPEEDADVVKRLKKAGAIIIGKTNTHQFAYGPTGDRSFYGPMRNPYDTTKMAGGSSGGSAASVAADLCTGALGTDTSGSIRIPSSFCGVVGMKPTHGKVPTKGVHPLAESLDCVGPMTKTVADNAIMMNVLTGKSSSDGYTSYIGKSVSGLSIGLPYPFFMEDLEQEVDTNLHSVKEHFKQAGIKIHPIHIPDMDTILAAQKTLIAYESYRLLENTLVDFPDLWDPEVKERLEKSIRTEEEYKKALKTLQASKGIFEKTMKNVDALLTPTSPILPPTINQRVLNHVTRDGTDTMVDVRAAITRLTAPTNITGLPSLTLPSGWSESGMPIGVQLIGNEHGEGTLYQIGHVLYS